MKDMIEQKDYELQGKDARIKAIQDLHEEEKKHLLAQLKDLASKLAQDKKTSNKVSQTPPFLALMSKIHNSQSFSRQIHSRLFTDNI